MFTNVWKQAQTVEIRLTSPSACDPRRLGRGEASRTHWAKSTTGRGLETEIEIRHIMATTSLKRTTSCTPIMDRNELDLKLEERLRDLREQLRHLEMSREIDRKLLDLKVSI
jgi:hypothetical protein